MFLNCLSYIHIVFALHFVDRFTFKELTSDDDYDVI